MKQIIYFALILSLASCKSHKPWGFSHKYDLKGISPIGLSSFNGALYISDGDHNRIIKLNNEGIVTDTINGFDRPMHITSGNGQLYIPNYGSDEIIKLDNRHNQSIVNIGDSMDAPSGIAINGEQIAIADFYNHRILYFDGGTWDSFGTEGHEKGGLYYPTDVALLDDKIYVADAYNNRVQVFDKQGNSIQIIGEKDRMNATTGLHVNTSNIYAVDFENNRVLIYDLKGQLKQVISEGLEKPTDVIVEGNKLYIINYKDHSINTYHK